VFTSAAKNTNIPNTRYRIIWSKLLYLSKI